MSFPVAAHWPWPIGTALYSTPFTQQYKTDTFFFSYPYVLYSVLSIFPVQFLLLFPAEPFYTPKNCSLNNSFNLQPGVFIVLTEEQNNL